jgi:hypothetical protein
MGDEPVLYSCGVLIQSKIENLSIGKGSQGILTDKLIY